MASLCRAQVAGECRVPSRHGGLSETPLAEVELGLPSGVSSSSSTWGLPETPLAEVELGLPFGSVEFHLDTAGERQRVLMTILPTAWRLVRVVSAASYWSSAKVWDTSGLSLPSLYHLNSWRKLSRLAWGSRVAKAPQNT